MGDILAGEGSTDESPRRRERGAMTIRSPSEYRADAQRIRERAQQVDVEDLRTTMLQIAAMYDKMADQVEKVAKQQAPKGR
jgi:hypothetical protein